jgi:tripartite-type tricarboxylate transporter receptor subunit TctC
MQRGTCLIALLVTLLGVAGVAKAQGWPSRTVRIIVPHTAGGPIDVPARGAAQELGKILGQPFIIENRDGADGIIGMEACAKATADGHTLCATGLSTMTINPLVRNKLPYDVRRDFVPIVYMGALNSVIVVNPLVAASSLRELVELAKVKPGTVAFGTFGNTSFASVFVGWVKATQGASFYAIPFKSTVQALQAAVAGDVQVASYAANAVASLKSAGKIKAFAVTGNKRSVFLPDVPTLREAGQEFDWSGWVGLFAPARTPREIVMRLNAEVARLLGQPAFTEQFITRIGCEIDVRSGQSVEDFAAFLKTDIEQVGRLIKLAGIQKQ